MSLCDSCREPGACCKRLYLFRNDVMVTEWSPVHALIRAATDWLPFVLHGDKQGPYTEGDSAPYHWYAYTCPLLTPEGRCGDYEHRPQLCRDLEPASSKLCVEYACDL